MKKQLFLLLAFVMTGAVAMAQNAGVWMVGGTFPLRKNQNLTIIMSENESLSYLLFHVLK